MHIANVISGIPTLIQFLTLAQILLRHDVWCAFGTFLSILGTLNPTAE